MAEWFGSSLERYCFCSWQPQHLTGHQHGGWRSDLRLQHWVKENGLAVSTLVGAPIPTSTPAPTPTPSPPHLQPAGH